MSGTAEPLQQRWRSVSVGWRAPLRAAHGGSDEGRELQLVRLHDPRDGVVGCGEAAELAGYLGVSAAQARAAALDVAFLDLRARRAGLPVWSLLGGSAALEVACNATIGADSPAMAADQAVAAVRAGFRTVKVKVGDPDDLARVATVRAAVGAEVALRIDANGAWDHDGAVGRLTELARYDLELCEEPVHGARELLAVASELPELLIAADESTDELLAVTGQRAGNLAVCLKVARGGITPLLAAAASARELGLQVYLASTLDGPLGIAAALHAAAVIVPDRACGLATLDRFDRPAPAGLVPHAGHLTPPPGVGLGDGLLDWYR